MDGDEFNNMSFGPVSQWLAPFGCLLEGNAVFCMNGHKDRRRFIINVNSKV
jgi:hypothetical protein